MQSKIKCSINIGKICFKLIHSIFFNYWNLEKKFNWEIKKNINKVKRKEIETYYIDLEWNLYNKILNSAKRKEL